MKNVEISGNLIASNLKFGLVASRFNDFFTNQLVKGAIDCIVRHGGEEKDITVVRVPGAFESPLAVQMLAENGKYDAIIALGCVIQGATPHAGLIGAQVTRSLTQISLACNVPVIDGVITADNLEQAIERSGTKAGNKGWNAALAAIEMANLKKQLKHE